MSNSEVKLKTKEKDFDAKSVFEAGLYRNRVIMIVNSDTNMAEMFAYKFKQGSGIIVDTAVIYNDDIQQASLRNMMRSYATSVLTNRTKVLFLSDPNRIIICEAMVKMVNGLSGSLLWIRDKTIEEQMTILKGLNMQLPVKVMPSVSNWMSVATINQNAGESNVSSYKSLQQYTKFQRNVVTSFASVLNSFFSRGDDESKVIQVVGYNPEYVDAGLLHNSRVRFIDLDRKYKGSLILPTLSTLEKYSSSKNESSSWILPDSQRKLNQIDSLMLTMAKNVIYIGSYPGTHLKNYSLNDWNIISIDPKIDEEHIKMLRNVCPNAQFEREYFTFSIAYLKSIMIKYGLSSNTVIIDDSYNDASTSYQNFQESKISFFERVMDMKDPDYPIIAASVKLNFKRDRAISYVKAILPQPFGGDLDELRMIMTPDGEQYRYRYEATVLPYVNAFNVLSLTDRTKFVQFYHRLVLENADALKYEYQPKSTIIALYSLTNTVNDVEKLKRFLVNQHSMRNPVIINIPNKGRIEYMISNKFKPGLDLKIRGNEITFKSPSKKVWQDHCLTGSEMIDMGYIQVTYEMLVGHLGAYYKGPGFMSNSAYSDMFGLYIPDFVFDAFFRFQHVGTGPISMVKSVTSHIRNMPPGITRSDYYTLRATLVAELMAKYNVSATKYVVVGDEQCAIMVIGDISFDTPYGVVNILGNHAKPVYINISGHLLSLTVVSHFFPTAIDAWISQLMTMSSERSVNTVIGYFQIQKFLLFDNKTNEAGDMFLSWHTKNELILTALILEKYVGFIMRRNYSSIIVQDVLSSFAKTLLQM